MTQTETRTGRTCTKCGMYKPADAFYRDQGRLRPICIECHLAYCRQHDGRPTIRCAACLMVMNGATRDALCTACRGTCPKCHGPKNPISAVCRVCQEDARRLRMEDLTESSFYRLWTQGGWRWAVLVRVDGRLKRVYRYRWLMERRLGRPLAGDEIIHHRNEDPEDDRLENLQVTTRAEHVRIHAALRHARFMAGD